MGIDIRWPHEGYKETQRFSTKVGGSIEGTFGHQCQMHCHHTQTAMGKHRLVPTEQMQWTNPNHTGHQ